MCCGLGLAGALAVLAPRPATRSALAFLEFFLGATDASFPGLLLLGVLDPADELVAAQRRAVFPEFQCGGIGE